MTPTSATHSEPSRPSWIITLALVLIGLITAIAIWRTVRAPFWSVPQAEAISFVFTSAGLLIFIWLARNQVSHAVGHIGALPRKSVALVAFAILTLVAAAVATAIVAADSEDVGWIQPLPLGIFLSGSSVAVSLVVAATQPPGPPLTPSPSSHVPVSPRPPN